MATLTAKEILARKCNVKKYVIESMDEAEIFVKEFTVDDLSKFQEASATDAAIITVILGVCDETGKPLFSQEDFDNLSELPQQNVMDMSLAVMQFNGMISERESAKN